MCVLFSFSRKNDGTLRTMSGEKVGGLHRKMVFDHKADIPYAQYANVASGWIYVPIGANVNMNARVNQELWRPITHCEQETFPIRTLHTAYMDS